MNSLLIFLKGLAMGAADIVPGVSGGTIAFITGIYDRFIDGLKKIGDACKLFAKFEWKEGWKVIDFALFIPLGLGIVTAFLIGSAFIPDLIKNYPAQVFSFFIGLIIASTWYVYKSIKTHNTQGWVFLFLGLLLGLTVALLPQSVETNVPNPFYILFLGAIAICAMLLPGISGSYILLMFGQYAFLLEMIHERNILYVGAFGIGAIFGLLLFSRLLSYLLKKHHASTFYALLGIMLGALLRPVQEVIRNLSSIWMSLTLVIIGIVVVLILEKITMN